jgi:hypothetical protein
MQWNKEFNQSSLPRKQTCSLTSTVICQPLALRTLFPFIVNGRESKTDIKDEDGNIIYQALPAADQNRIFEGQRVPRNFHFVVATYSQFNSPEKKPTKPAFLNAIAEDNIVIMDEAHNSSGSGNTGNFMQSALSKSRGVVFLVGNIRQAS